MIRSAHWSSRTVSWLDREDAGAVVGVVAADDGDEGRGAGGVEHGGWKSGLGPGRPRPTAPADWDHRQSHKGKRARVVPLIEELHEVVERRIAASDGHPDSRLFTGPRGGRIST